MADYSTFLCRVFLHVPYIPQSKKKHRYGTSSQTACLERTKYGKSVLSVRELRGSLQFLSFERGERFGVCTEPVTQHMARRRASCLNIKAPKWIILRCELCLAQRSFPFPSVVFIGYRPMRCGYNPTSEHHTTLTQTPMFF